MYFNKANCIDLSIEQRKQLKKSPGKSNSNSNSIKLFRLRSIDCVKSIQNRIVIYRNILVLLNVYESIKKQTHMHLHTHTQTGR